MNPPYDDPAVVTDEVCLDELQVDGKFDAAGSGLRDERANAVIIVPDERPL